MHPRGISSLQPCPECNGRALPNCKSCKGRGFILPTFEIFLILLLIALIYGIVFYYIFT